MRPTEDLQAYRPDKSKKNKTKETDKSAQITMLMNLKKKK